MNLYQSLEEEHSKKQCDRIVKYIGRDKERIAELVQLFLKIEEQWEKATPAFRSRARKILENRS